MKRMLMLVLAAVVVARPVVAQADAGKAVAALEDAWGSAYLKKDVAALSKLLADDFTAVFPDGKMYDKAGYLSFVKGFDNSGLTSHNENVKARVYGNVVVITGVSVEVKKTASGSTTTRTIWTDTWAKSGDTWRCVAGHNSTIK